MKLSFVHKLLIIGGVFIIGVFLMSYAFFMIIVNPNPLMVGDWDVSEDSFGDVPDPFASNTEHFTFYTNDTVRVVDTSHNSEWFTYELFVDYAEGNGILVFTQGTSSWSFQYDYTDSTMNLTSLSCSACTFSIVRLF